MGRKRCQRRFPLGPTAAALLAVFLALALPSLARAAVLGDLDGNGVIDQSDLTLLWSIYGTTASSPTYDGGGDLNSDGGVDYRDLAILSASFGQTPSPVPPATLFLTVDAVPDDMNDLLAVPRSGFTINFTLTNPPGAPLIDVNSASLVADQPAGPLPAGANLALLFPSITPTRGSLQIDSVHAFPPRNVFFTLSLQNRRGDVLSPPVYGVAVRDWTITPPIGAGQKVFYDFDQDRDGVGGNDFDEDLRAFGLGSTSFPSLSAAVRSSVISRVLGGVRAFYGENADGTPGPDPVTIAFSASPTTGATRICVGGEDPTGGVTFGLTPFDKNNAQTGTDTCAMSPNYGIFPREFLFFSGNPNFRGVFDPLMPSTGGVPVGESALDPIVLAQGFDPLTAPPDQAARWSVIDRAESTFAQFVATIVAHETGHTLGLTASGAAPGGLWGGSSGPGLYHNVTTTGGTPSTNWLMNAGSAFTYERIVGAAGEALPRFRELNAAYLRNQLMLKSNITVLLPAPTLTSVTPNPVSYVSGTATITLHGSNFFGTPLVYLERSGSTPKQVQGVTLVDAGTLSGTINQFQVGTGTFDVELNNPDDQQVTLPAGLTVQ